MGRKKKARMDSELDDNAKTAICVRMDQALFDMIRVDAENGDRTAPAQIRRILKKHYGLDEETE